MGSAWGADTQGVTGNTCSHALADMRWKAGRWYWAQFPRENQLVCGLQTTLLMLFSPSKDDSKILKEDWRKMYNKMVCWELCSSEFNFPDLSIISQ